MPKVSAASGNHITIACAVGLGFLVWASAAGAGRGDQIVATATVLRIGVWQVEPYRGHASSYADAISAFGRPDTCVRGNGAIQGIARWGKIGVTLYAATLGYAGPGKTACNDPRDWQVDHVVVSGKNFATTRGLRVGDSVSRLHALYPDSKWHSGWNEGVWLISREVRCVIGDCSSTPTVTQPRLVARIANGRISSFLLPVGSQGE